MKKLLSLTLFLMGCFLATGQQKTFHDFTVTTLEGEPFALSGLKGKKVMVVNVASRCGLTPQYEQLQKLYEQYADRQFTIVAFPANNFRDQEPGTAEDIRLFCTENYGVTFPVMYKISVAGDDADPVYRWLSIAAENGKHDAPVTWNFQKFLIDEQGGWVGVLPPRTLPDTAQVVRWIETGVFE